MMPHSTDVNKALDLLFQGELVGIPTETVYGLAADASNPYAASKIFSAKGRPTKHPVIVHIASSQYLNHWAVDIPDQAWKLAEAFWPGPLTLILKRHPGVSDMVTGGLDTVGLRVPRHVLTLELLHRFRGGLAVPSANRFGQVSPTTAAHVRSEFDESVLRLVLDGGACEVGIESTIIGLYDRDPILLRPGYISPELIEACLGTSLIREKQDKVRVPGSLDSHYAPHTPLIVKPMAGLLEAMTRFSGGEKSLALLVFGNSLSSVLVPNMTVYNMPNNPEIFAQQLYATLRSLDQQGLDAIFMEAPPEAPRWLAINDRLARASHKYTS